MQAGNVEDCRRHAHRPLAGRDLHRDDFAHHLYRDPLCLFADADLVCDPGDAPCVIHDWYLRVKRAHKRPVVARYLFAGDVAGKRDLAQSPRVLKLPA